MRPWHPARQSRDDTGARLHGVRPPPGYLALRAERETRRNVVALHMGRAVAGSRVRRLKNGPDHFDILVSSLAIGDSLAFAGLPGEPFVDIGRAIKDRSPFRMTVVTCLTNGSEGYIPSTKSHADGGYESLSSKFAAPTGDRLVNAQISQLTALKGNTDGTKPSLQEL